MTAIQISMAFSIGSLVFGIGSWIFAGLAIAARKAPISHRNSFWSFGLCIFSLVFQLFEINNRVRIGDYSAVEDTIGAVILASVVLIAVTVSLNAAAWQKAKKLPQY